jgi:hypothetical protein
MKQQSELESTSNNAAGDNTSPAPIGHRSDRCQELPTCHPSSELKENRSSNQRRHDPGRPSYKRRRHDPAPPKSQAIFIVK